MKQRLADYVADFLAARGVTDVFSVVGGGAMHLNDALGHNPRLHVTYNHHEQACAIAAEAYARLENKIAAVCVTTGPGGTNALTGVVGGWLDSIPMFIVSGQVRYDTTARYALQYTGTPLRAMGDQEYDITKSVQYMTKFAAMLEDPKDIRYLLEKAWHPDDSGKNQERQTASVPRGLWHPPVRRVCGVPLRGGKAQHPHRHLLERRGPHRG